MKQYDKAEHFFKKALLYSESIVPRDRWYACLSYGSFLNSSQRYREALKLFEEAEKISIGHKPYAQEYYMYLAKSEALEALGSFSDALQAYKGYNRLLTEADSSLTLEKLSSILSTNRTYLSKAIRLKTGMSYSAFINELRLNESIRILSSSSSPEVVKSVANAVGFYNQSTFYRLFKQKTNLSPAQFRQQSYNLEQRGQYEEISEEEG